MTPRLLRFVVTALLATFAAVVMVGAIDERFGAWARERVLAAWTASGCEPSPRPPPLPAVPPLIEASPPPVVAEPAIRGRLVPWPLLDRDPDATVNGHRVASDGTFAVPAPHAPRHWLWLEWGGGVAWCQEVELEPGRGRNLGIVWLPSPASLAGRVAVADGKSVRDLEVRIRCPAPVNVRAPVREDGSFEIYPLPPGLHHAAICRRGSDEIAIPITEWPPSYASAPPLELYSDERRDLGTIASRPLHFGRSSLHLVLR